MSFLILKILWNADESDDVFILSVDGTDCPIQEPRNNPNSDWYSHKLNGPGLDYELGLEIHRNQLCWINGPFPAGYTDLRVFRLPDGLKGKIPEGKLVIADNGYKGEPTIRIPNRADSEIVKTFKRRVKARHESFNRLLKEYHILSTDFRHPLEKHKTVFVAICVICQYNMESERHLWDL